PRYGGSYAEYHSVPSLSVVRKPATLSHIEAAAAPLAALTAWGMVVEVAKAHEGQRMLIHAGSGGVGHFAVQFASYFGAHVIATASGGK
ncbi:NADP-dependent oxidoreductase, partial [Bacillus sp. SIMBA_069]